MLTTAKLNPTLPDGEIDSESPQPPSKGYTLSQLWKDLQIDYETFMAKKSEPEQQSDQAAFEKSQAAIKEMIRLGNLTENAFFLKKPFYGHKISSLFQERFGEEKMPDIEGNLSLQFAKEVMLPFLKNSYRLEHSEWLKRLAKLAQIDLNEKKQIAKDDTEKLEAKMDRYLCSLAASLLSKQGLYAVKSQPTTSMDCDTDYYSECALK